MEKVRLTAEQSQDIESLRTFFTDKVIAKMHRQFNRQWGRAYMSLNDMPHDILEAALFEGYIIVSSNIKSAGKSNASKKPSKIVPKEYQKKMLEMSTDYWLASLYDALNENDEEYIAKCKEELMNLQEGIE